MQWALMDFVPAPTEANGSPCDVKMTRYIICRASGWKDVAEVRYILFVFNIWAQSIATYAWESIAYMDSKG